MAVETIEAKTASTTAAAAAKAAAAAAAAAEAVAAAAAATQLLQPLKYQKQPQLQYEHKEPQHEKIYVTHMLLVV